MPQAPLTVPEGSCGQKIIPNEIYNTYNLH